MKKFILSLLLLFTCISVSSCSSFIGDDEAITITEIKQELGKNDKGEDGIFIIISYANEGKNPDKFFVPNGKQGEIGLTGNGIAKIDKVVDKETFETTITITFTDEKMAPMEYKVPVGVSMKGITTKVLEDGSTSLVINFTDGKNSDPIILPKGEKGDGYKSYEIIPHEDGSQTLKLYFDNHDPVIIEIAKPNDGNGITSMSCYTDDTLIYIDVIYTNGDTQQITFNRPNTWLRGPRGPVKEEGLIGDFYFDTAHKVIYEKNWSSDEIGEWKQVISLIDKENAYFDVTFDLNDTLEEPARMPGQSLVVTCKEGTYFGISDMELPIPVRDGYDFDGWYLTRSPRPTNGRFTDTTPVFANITLYAKWNKAN